MAAQNNDLTFQICVVSLEVFTPRTLSVSVWLFSPFHTQNKLLSFGQIGVGLRTDRSSWRKPKTRFSLLTSTSPDSRSGV